MMSIDGIRAQALASAPEVSGPNHALLMGMVWSAVHYMARRWAADMPTAVEIVDMPDGTHTARLLVHRRSGSYIVDVTPLDVEEP